LSAVVQTARGRLQSSCQAETRAQQEQQDEQVPFHEFNGLLRNASQVENNSSAV
jgi:hypothetical protein